MLDIGKFLIAFGAVLVIVGIAIIGLRRIGFKGLPGDLNYRSEHVQVYFPIVSCIVLSILLTLGMGIWRWLSSK